MSIVLIEILIVRVLFIANGAFAMSEMAVVSSRKSRLKQMGAAGDAGAAAALRLAETPNRFSFPPSRSASRSQVARVRVMGSSARGCASRSLTWIAPPLTMSRFRPNPLRRRRKP